MSNELIESLSLDDARYVLSLIQLAANKVDQEKSHFLQTTELKDNSSKFLKIIWDIKRRKRNIGLNSNLITDRISRLKKERNNEIEKFCRVFWKNAKTILNNGIYKKILEETEKKIKMPECLKNETLFAAVSYTVEDNSRIRSITTKYGIKKAHLSDLS